MTRPPATTSAPPGRPPRLLRGLAWMLLAAFASSVMNGCIRHVSAEVHAFEIAFFRNVFGLAVLAPLLLRGRGAGLRTGRLGLHALRGLLNAVAMLSFFLALGTTPLATVAALGFTSPLFATLLAAVVLKERVGPRRAVGVLLGFAGALVVLRPGVGVVSPGALLVLLSSAAWAAALIDIKLLARTESSLTITVYAGLFLTPITLVAAVPFWSWPGGEALLWLALVGGLGSLTQLAIAQAFHEAEASQVLPADFTKLPWAAAVGLAFYGEVPDLFTILGGGLICASVAYVAWREVGPRGAG